MIALQTIAWVLGCAVIAALFSSTAACQQVKPVRAEVKMHNGSPAVFVNGKPIFFNGFVAIDCLNPKINKGMADAGVHIYDHSVSLGHRTEEKYDYSDCDDLLQKVTAVDPQAYFVIRLGTEVEGMNKWLVKHPKDVIKWADGTTGPLDTKGWLPISRSSKPWLKDASTDLTVFVKHIRSGPYADRVLGLFVCDVQACEWFGPLLWEGGVGDFSEASTEAFRQWLRAKYKTEAALRRAWKDPSVTFSRVTVPTVEERKVGEDRIRFRDPAKLGTRITDWYLYYSEVNADAIAHFARIVKQASDGNMLVGSFYGYLNVFGPYQLESQHNAVTRLLRCPDLDFMGSPSHYGGRGPGGTSVSMTMVESILLHGKMNINESDIRTHVTQDPIGRCTTPAETAGVLKRELGNILSRGQSFWWADMSFGTYDDPDVLALIKQLKTAGDQSMLRSRLGSAEIAVILDDKSWTVCRPGVGVEVDGKTDWPRLGASQSYYLLSDIANPKLPRHKLYVFMNAYSLTDGEIRAIHARLKKDHATALWMYAPGYVSETGLSTERMKTLTGINLVCIPQVQASTIKMNGSQKRAVFRGLKDPTGVKGADGDGIGTGPVFYADDPRTEVLGLVEPLHKPGFVIKQMDGWRSVYYASSMITPEALRAVADYAGVHIYSSSNDCFFADRGIICLHAAKGGWKLIDLPKTCDVFDLLTGERIATNTKRLKLNVKEKDTVLLRVE